MAERYDINVTVISQKGTCVKDHKVGDEFFISNTTPDGICLSAFNSLFPSLQTLRFGGTFPWAKDPDTVTIACSDAENPVVFELRRIRAAE
ncbi:TIGR04076 family protein [Thermodesulfobacteriota bacterium]